MPNKKATATATDSNIIAHSQETEKPITPTDQEVHQPSLEDPNSDSQQEDGGDENMISCQTSSHLKTYPLISESSKFIDEFLITKAIKDTTFPALKSIGGFAHRQSLLRPIVTTVDNFGNSTLTTAENWMPCLKTTRWEDVLDTVKAPIISTDEAIKNAAVATNDCVEMRILTPVRSMVENSRTYYNEHLYDTKGKPLIRSSLDPVFRPINNQVEIFTLKNFEKSEPISNKYSSEIERTLYLSIDLIDRSIPVVENKIVETIMVPCNLTMHVFEVYNEELNKQEGNIISSSMKATYNTSIDLSNEAWDETTGLWKKVWGNDKSNNQAEEEDHPEDHSNEDSKVKVEEGKAESSTKANEDSR